MIDTTANITASIGLMLGFYLLFKYAEKIMSQFKTAATGENPSPLLTGLCFVITAVHIAILYGLMRLVAKMGF